MNMMLYGVVRDLTLNYEVDVVVLRWCRFIWVVSLHWVVLLHNIVSDGGLMPDRSSYDLSDEGLMPDKSFLTLKMGA